MWRSLWRAASHWLPPPIPRLSLPSHPPCAATYADHPCTPSSRCPRQPQAQTPRRSPYHRAAVLPPSCPLFPSSLIYILSLCSIMLSVLFHSLHRCSLNFALLLSALFKFSLFLVCSFSFLLLLFPSFFLSFSFLVLFLVFFPAFLISFSLFRKKDRNREREDFISIFLKFDFSLFQCSHIKFFSTLSSCLVGELSVSRTFYFYRLSPLFIPHDFNGAFPSVRSPFLFYSSRFLFSNLSLSLVIRFSACTRDRMELTFWYKPLGAMERVIDRFTRWTSRYLSII